MNPKPILVTPKVCFGMLDVGTTKGYELINGRKLEIVKIGRATRITVASIEAYVASLLAEREAA
jgi:hypothetical protein